MNWDYRVVEVFGSDDGETQGCRYYIHEFYYGPEGEVIGRTADPVECGGHTDMHDMLDDLKLVFMALAQPVIRLSLDEYND